MRENSRDSHAVEGLKRCRKGLRRVFGFQMIDIRAVGIGQRRAFDEQNVLCVELRAPREVIGARDHRIVDHENFVVHEIVAPGRGVRR